MNRLGWGALTAVCASLGCRNPDVHLTELTTFWADTEGFAFDSTATTGYLAMVDTTCAVDVQTGWFVGDFDVSEGTERIVDALGDDVLAVSPDGLHVISATELASNQDLPVDGAVAGALTGDGVWSLALASTGCTLTQQDETVPLPDEACTGDAVVVATDGGAAVGTSEGLWSVDAAGNVTKLASSATDLAAWKGGMVACDGQDVTAYDGSAEVLWTTDLGTGVVSVDSIGPDYVGAVLDGGGLVVLYSGDGTELGTEESFPEGELAGSSDGRTLACEHDEGVTLYAGNYGTLEAPERETGPTNSME